MERKSKDRYVDYDIIEGRKPPSKEELEEGELEHLFIVDYDAWEKKMKEKKSSKPNNVKQTVPKALKDISNGAARFPRSWVHEGPRSFIVAKRNQSKPQLPSNRVIREDGKAFLEEYKENREAVDEMMKKHRASQQCLDPDIEIRQLKKRVDYLETQTKDIWAQMRSMEKTKK